MQKRLVEIEAVVANAEVERLRSAVTLAIGVIAANEDLLPQGNVPREYVNGLLIQVEAVLRSALEEPRHEQHGITD